MSVSLSKKKKHNSMLSISFTSELTPIFLGIEKSEANPIGYKQWNQLNIELNLYNYCDKIKCAWKQFYENTKGPKAWN